MRVKDITSIALLSAIAIILSIVESYIPSIGIPGIKLGLANVIIIITLYAFGWHYALLVNVLRVFLASLLRGTIFQMGFFMSLSGAIISLLVMILLKEIIKKLHIITVSIIGSVFHIAGQIIIALIYLETTGILFYVPILMLSSIITGIIVGILATNCLRIPIFENRKNA